MSTIHRPNSGPNFRYEKAKPNQTQNNTESAATRTGSTEPKIATLRTETPVWAHKALSTDTVELSTRSFITNASNTEDPGKGAQSTSNPFAKTTQSATTGEPTPKPTFALRTQSQSTGLKTTAENNESTFLPGVQPAQGSTLKNLNSFGDLVDLIGDILPDEPPPPEPPAPPPPVLTPEEEAEVARSPLPIKPGDPNAVKLSRNLQLIYGTADGKKLIDKVVQNGGSIGTSTDWPNATGSQISVRDENMDVIVHELVHAATLQDDDSLVEEGVGTAIAVRTVNEIAAKNPGIDVGPRFYGTTDPTAAYFWGRDNNPAEAHLPDSNNILGSLAEIGIIYEIPPGGPPIGGEDGRQVAA